MWLVREAKSICLLWYLVSVYWTGRTACLNNRGLMAARSTSRALSIPYDIAESLGVENQVNEPYRFSYKVQDNSDNMQFRNEEKTVDGNVKGSYGYKDANGMYRMVNYYVDANGFHAKVFSNEPGVLPRRDHVNSINRELFAKQTPLAYNPANVEWVINHQPDFSRVNTMASEYNGDWRSNSGNDLSSSPLYRENYAFHGGDQYAGAASQLIESRRLNSVNSLDEKQKQLSLLVLPKTTRTVNSSPILPAGPPTNYKLSNPILSAPAKVNPPPVNRPTILSEPLSQPPSQPPSQPLDQPLDQPLSQPLNQPSVALLQGAALQIQQPSATLQPAPINHPHHRTVQPITRQQPVTSITNTLPQAVRKERKRTTVRRVAKIRPKDQTYFSPKIDIPRREPEATANSPASLPANSPSGLLGSENLSLNEFSAKFPEKWHQIFSGKAFANFEDKPANYAQLEAVAVRPDVVSVLADQSFMKPAKREQPKLSRRIDRVGSALPAGRQALPRKAVRYVPPLNSAASAELLLTSASVQHPADRSTSSQQLMPRMMNPPTSTPRTIASKVQQSAATETIPQTIPPLTPTTVSSLINPSLASEPITNPASTMSASSTMQPKATTMSPTMLQETQANGAAEEARNRESNREPSAELNGERTGESKGGETAKEALKEPVRDELKEESKQEPNVETNGESKGDALIRANAQPKEESRESKGEPKTDESKEKVKLPERAINTTESPLTTSTSVSIVTSTSIDQSRKDHLKVTKSPISRV